MGEVEYHCGGCGEYFEAVAGGADCWHCGSSNTSQMSEPPAHRPDGLNFSAPYDDARWKDQS
jgi:hypothetical protein